MIISSCLALFGLMPFVIEKLIADRHLLIAMFICNTLTLTCVLISFYFCYKGNVEDLNFAEEYYMKKKEEFLNKQSYWTKLGEKFNFISMLFMTFTFTLFATICICSILNKDSAMNDTTKQLSTRIQDGLTSAKMVPCTKPETLEPLSEGCLSGKMTPYSAEKGSDKNTNQQQSQTPTPNPKK